MRIADGFTVKNRRNLKPVEDAYAFSGDGKAIVVADGITRDARRTPVLRFPENKLDVLGYLGAMRFFASYPKEGGNPARLVCSLFASDEWREKTPEYVRKRVEDINQAVGRVNETTRRVQKWKEFDYLEHDIPGCVAAGAVEDNGRVSYFYIADCGIAILDRFGYEIFRTKNEGPNSRGSIDKDISEKFGEDFNHPGGRKRIRRDYRNNPENQLSYGALTGEPEAMSYVRTGQVEARDGVFLIGYSDGLEGVIGINGFRKILFEEAARRNFGVMNEKLRRLCQKQVSSEGTLVYMIR
ncbi:MAG: hypothetical protein KKE50_02155 [Nanoarchaeota archaeon]|nr:hypothetical protein [Nanoarchaeota archaeon]